MVSRCSGKVSNPSVDRSGTVLEDLESTPSERNGSLLAENVFQSLLCVMWSVVFPMSRIRQLHKPSTKLTTVDPLNWLLLP